MEKGYSRQESEKRVYEKWMEKEAFSSAYDIHGRKKRQTRKKEVFVVPIPPPNVTGRLHLGHALNTTVIDALVRYKRMDGFDALWIPGIDHAGIATQTVVKKWIDEEGVDYRSLGKKDFVAKVWQWKEKYGSLILSQIKSLGASCDWTRTRFTMDEGFSRAVRKAFCLFYADGLIYRGERIVNWCPVDKTALSDDEVEVKEGGEAGFLWRIKYEWIDGKKGEGLVVATTRPETLFGDAAVAVHPDDERYKSFIGKKLKVPFTGREIPVIADEAVEKDFGTGCVKITPAHDPNDFEMGLRHDLKPINVMNEDATMNDMAPKAYQGLDRFACRKKLLDDLRAEGLLLKEEERNVPLGRSYRSKAVIEYRLSKQWFVRAEPLAKKVLDRHHELNITPKNWDKVYRHWLNNIRDWCISRQLWWGHSIPAWHHKETGEILISEDTPEVVQKNPSLWKEDEDVLDTWFSSALWPLIITGWPDRSASDFQRYFPTTLLSTAKDILFFWVARMNFMSVHFEGKTPYREVYIHPVILDAKGQTMSKSKGNGIDPMHVIVGASLDELKTPILEARPKEMKTMLSEMEKNFPKGLEGVGADGLRYTLMQTCTSGQEVKLSLGDFSTIGARFIIKLWNAAYFVLSKLNAMPNTTLRFEVMEEDLSLDQNWMRDCLNEAVLKVRKALDTYDFSSLTKTYYDLVWTHYCDWYLEMMKVGVKDESSPQNAKILTFSALILRDILKLLHPVIPFVTEELWSHAQKALGGKSIDLEESDDDLLMLSSFPSFKLEWRHDEARESMDVVMRFVKQIRALSSEFLIKEKMDVVYFAANEKTKDVLSSSKDLITALAKLKSVEEADCKQEGFCLLERDFEIYIRLKDFVDVESETRKIEKELLGIKKDIAFVEGKLSNESFVLKAPKEKVREENNKLTHYLEKASKLEKLLSDLKQN